MVDNRKIENNEFDGPKVLLVIKKTNRLQNKAPAYVDDPVKTQESTVQSPQKS